MSYLADKYPWRARIAAKALGKPHYLNDPDYYFTRWDSEERVAKIALAIIRRHRVRGVVITQKETGEAFSIKSQLISKYTCKERRQKKRLDDANYERRWGTTAGVTTSRGIEYLYRSAGSIARH